MTTKKLPPVHPGEVLLEEFLKPLRLSQNRLALSIGVPPRRMTAETVLRLARYFDTARGGEQDGFYMSDVRCRMTRL